MKYLVFVLDQKEHMVVFPRVIDHDRMFEALENVRFGSQRDWYRTLRAEGSIVSAGFIEAGRCTGRSETLSLASRPQDNELLHKLGLMSGELK